MGSQALDLSDLTLLYGGNATGKTSILRAFRLLANTVLAPGKPDEILFNFKSREGSEIRTRDLIYGQLNLDQIRRNLEIRQSRPDNLGIAINISDVGNTASGKRVIKGISEVSFGISENVGHGDSDAVVEICMVSDAGHSITFRSVEEMWITWELSCEDEEAQEFFQYVYSQNANIDDEVLSAATGEYAHVVADYFCYSEGLLGQPTMDFHDTGWMLNQWGHVGEGFWPELWLHRSNVIDSVLADDILARVYAIMFPRDSQVGIINHAAADNPVYLFDLVLAKKSYAAGSDEHFKGWSDRVKAASSADFELREFAFLTLVLNYCREIVRETLRGYLNVDGMRDYQEVLDLIRPENTGSESLARRVQAAFSEFTDHRYSIKFLAVPTSRGSATRAELKDEYTGAFISFDQVGTGLRQVLPVIASVISASERGGDSKCVAFVQQPELHLHHKYQAKLAEFFAQEILENGLQLIVETHSESLLMRVQKMIRTGRFPSSSLAIGYTQQVVDSRDISGELVAGHNEIFNLQIETNGDIEKFPESFADLRLSDWF